MLAEIAFMARTVVAVAFVLSAGWKLRNAREFAAALAETSPALSRHAGPVRMLLAGAELAVGAALLATGVTGRAAALAALALTVVTTVTTLRRRSLDAGCGCWRAAAGDAARRGPLVARNAVLASVAALGATGGGAIPVAHSAFLLPVAVAFALLILELPTFAAWTRYREV